MLRKAKLSIVIVSGLEIYLFSDLAAPQKGVKTFTEKSRLYLDLRPFNVQLTRLEKRQCRPHKK